MIMYGMNSTASLFPFLVSLEKYSGHFLQAVQFPGSEYKVYCWAKCISLGQQNRFAFHHDVVQCPFFRSKRSCSERTTKNATTAVINPTMVTIIHPRLLSNARRSRDLRDLRFLSLEKRAASLIAS